MTKVMPRPGKRDVAPIEAYTPGKHDIDVEGLSIYERTRYIDGIHRRIKLRTHHDSHGELLEGDKIYRLIVLEDRKILGDKENGGM